MVRVQWWWHSKYFDLKTFKIKDGTPAEERRKLETAIAEWQSPPVENPIEMAKEIAALMGEEL
jgi:hypothetical protein